MPAPVSLPVIDLTGSRSGDAAALHDCAAQIAAACREHGFFYVRGHGIAQGLIDDTFALSRRFFALPEDVKTRWHIDRSGIQRGFDPVGWQVLDPGKPADLKESFYLGVDRGPDDALVRAGTPQQGPNQWPDEQLVPGFKATTQAYEAAVRQLGHHLMGLIALGLKLPRDHFESYLRDPMPILRLLHYPTQPAQVHDGQIGCGAHTDWGALTLLMQDGAGGLEVLGADGRWIVAPPIAGSYVVNLGDLMQRWTNDRYRSTLHRVHSPAGRDGQAGERYSIAYFFEIDYHARVSALPGCFDADDPPHHPPISAGDHIVEMYRRTTVAPA